VHKDTSYSPLFIAPDSVTAGKHMEAIRESVGDFEYLCLLRDRVGALERTQPRHKLLPQARKLLAGAAGRVLSARGAKISEYKAPEMAWDKPRDRACVDVVRIEIGEMLEKLRY